MQNQTRNTPVTEATESSSLRQIENLTSMLRNSTGSLISGIRTCVLAKGLGIDEVILVDCFSVDFSLESGILVTRQGKVIRFVYDYSYRTTDKGCLTEWQNITDEWHRNPQSCRISIALSAAEFI